MRRGVQMKQDSALGNCITVLKVVHKEASMASDCGAAILQAEGAIEKYMAQAGPSYTDRASALDALKTEWAWTTEQQRDNDPALIADYIAAVERRLAPNE